MVTLYDYPKSSAAYRVRIALNLKQLPYRKLKVSLLDNDQLSSAYLQLNPNGSVPTLKTEQGILTQSTAIIEYLDEYYPDPPLLPLNSFERAQCRALSQLIVSDMHPLNNLRALNYLRDNFATTESQKNQWYFHWLTRGFDAVNAQLVQSTTAFCCGDTPSIADICLVPQLFNARRFHFDLSPYPRLTAIEAECQQLHAFQLAQPDNQVY